MSIVSEISRSADLVRRIRGEYLEMPGLRLTARQAQRRFGLSATTCDDVLEDLLQSGFLSRTAKGIFHIEQRSSAGAVMIRMNATEKHRTRIIARLHELVSALDRRVPQIHRAGEQRIASESAVLRKKAQERPRLELGVTYDFPVGQA